MQVSNKTFVVTGVGSGICRELTFGMLDEGANVAGFDINQTALLEIGQQAKVGEDRFKAFPLDITSKDYHNLEEYEYTF